MHNLDKEVAASGFTKEMEEEFDDVRILPEGIFKSSLSIDYVYMFFLNITFSIIFAIS